MKLRYFLLPLSLTLKQLFLCNMIFDYSNFLGILNHCILEEQATSRDTGEAGNGYKQSVTESTCLAMLKHLSIFTCLPDF